MAAAVRWAGIPAVAPMLATLGELPAGDVDEGFGYEIKWDGVRAVGYVGDGFRLVSRNGRDVTAAYPELAPPRQVAGRGGLIVDGEIVAFDSDGTPSFAALQSRMHQRDPRRVDRLRDQSPVVYIVFDVLRHKDRSVTRLVYRERRTLLDALGLDPACAWQAPEYQCGGGALLFAATREAGLEGVIAKRLDSVYSEGRRSADWIKIKHLLTREVVVGGWTSGRGRREGSIGALILGVPNGDRGPGGRSRRGGALEFVGLVGTGFTDRALNDLTRRLAPLAHARSPFARRVPPQVEREAHWVRPDLVGEVAYAGLTRGGLLRIPSWRGLRADKAPCEIEAERATGEA